jgi:hypothetical protein
VVQRPEPPVAGGERADRVVQVGHAEVRPERRADVQLGVADLPQQVVAHPHLAGRPDEQVRVGHAGRVQVVRDHRLVDLLRPQPAVPHVPGDRPHGVDDLRPAAVVQGQHERQPGVVLRLVQRPLHLAEDRVGQVVEPADLPEPDVVRHHRGPLAPQVLDVHLHEERDLVDRPLPVLEAERVEREVVRPADLPPQAGALGDDLADGLGPLLVPADPVQPAADGPPAVPVHDHRDVPGDLVRRQVR